MNAREAKRSEELWKLAAAVQAGHATPVSEEQVALVLARLLALVDSSENSDAVTLEVRAVSPHAPTSEFRISRADGGGMSRGGAR